MTMPATRPVMTENESPTQFSTPSRQRMPNVASGDQQRAEIDAHAQRTEQFAHRGPLLRAHEEDAEDREQDAHRGDQHRGHHGLDLQRLGTGRGRRPRRPAPPWRGSNRSSSRKGRRPCRPRRPRCRPRCRRWSRDCADRPRGCPPRPCPPGRRPRRPPWCRCRRRHARTEPASRRPCRRSASSW